METFTIERAVTKWRAAMTASEGISNDAIEELEVHLHESMNELEASGLSEEEAFLIASRRLGECDALDREFSSVSSHTVWKRRGFWMLLGFIDISALLLAISLIGWIGTWAAVTFAPTTLLPAWAVLSYITPAILLAVAGVITWRWIVRSAPSEITEVFGKHPLLLSVATLVILLVLRAGSVGISMIAAKTLSMENLGTIALHTSVANSVMNAGALLAICVGLSILGKSLLTAKTS